MSDLITSDVATIIVILLFALVVVVIVTVAASRARREALALIRRSMEEGKPLDPVVIERLLPPRPDSSRLLMPGIMTTALGLGVAVAGLIAGSGSPDEMTKKVFSGIVLFFLGIGLSVSALIARKRGI